MTKIKKGDFVEVEYTGTVKEDNIVFDTTDEKIAKENDIHSPKMEYGPIVVCLGEGQLLKGLEEEIEGNETGKEYTVELTPEKAFGKKDAKLIKMIPHSVFRKQNIQAQPGLQVNIDGMLGVIRNVGGGRCLVDFNHPLSGKELIYKIKINKIITDDKLKIESYLKLSLNIKVDADVKDKTAKLKLKVEIPKEVQAKIKEQLLKVITSVKKIEFVVEKKEKKKKESPPTQPPTAPKA